MKLLRYGAQGAEKPGLLDNEGVIRDLSGIVDDLAGAALSRANLAKLAALDTASLPKVEGRPRLGVPVAGTGKFMCIGLNYADHAVEMGVAPPSEPVIFMKATSTLSGPNDRIILPRGSTKTDWEVELAVIIGEHAKYVRETDAMNYVAGFAVTNDISERAFQFEREGQWTKGKSCDTFGPVGPWLVTPDEVPNVQNLNMWLTVNDAPMQAGNTRTMVYSVAYIVHYVSQFMSLYPGDIISTGTPPGVGNGLKPPRFLRAGDKVALGIEGLGAQIQQVMQEFISQ